MEGGQIAPNKGAVADRPSAKWYAKKYSLSLTLSKNNSICCKRF